MKRDRRTGVVADDRRPVALRPAPYFLDILRRERRDGAHPGLFLELFSDLPELSAEVAAGLHALMAISTVDVNRERLEFLG